MDWQEWRKSAAYFFREARNATLSGLSGVVAMVAGWVADQHAWTVTGMVALGVGLMLFVGSSIATVHRLRMARDKALSDLRDTQNPVDPRLGESVVTPRPCDEVERTTVPLQLGPHDLPESFPRHCLEVRLKPEAEAEGRRVVVRLTGPFRLILASYGPGMGKRILDLHRPSGTMVFVPLPSASEGFAPGLPLRLKIFSIESTDLVSARLEE